MPKKSKLDHESIKEFIMAWLKQNNGMHKLVDATKGINAMHGTNFGFLAIANTCKKYKSSILHHYGDACGDVMYIGLHPHIIN